MCLVNVLKTDIYIDSNHQQLLLSIVVGEGELEYIAHWITNHLSSKRVSALPGTLVLVFTIEEADEEPFLLPDWCAAFYVNSDADNCIPIIALQSILHHESFPTDWTESALYRLQSYRLPVDMALKAAAQMRPE